jgi:RNA polymerase sigma-70 factor (ECF subfamily)
MCAAFNSAIIDGADRLVAAHGADEPAFRHLVEAHSMDLHVHCYRMLGSLHDANDAMQETLLRAWRALPRFQGRSSHRTWLYRIATNVCLDAIARRPKRVLPIDYGPPAGPGDDESEEPLADSVWIEPYPDEDLDIGQGPAAPEARYEQREAVELAFIAALQHLPAQQRAVLILRDVLSFSAKETADSLDTTVAAVNGALQRARKAVDERLPARSQEATLRSLGDDAFERGDVDAILALLTEDATFAMPPYARWSRGRDAIGNSWLMPGGPPPRLRYIPTRANGQVAVGTYLLNRGTRGYLPLALDVLTLDGTQIADVTAFRTPQIFPHFGLPDRVSLPGDHRSPMTS